MTQQKEKSTNWFWPWLAGCLFTFGALMAAGELSSDFSLLDNAKLMMVVVIGWPFILGMIVFK